MFFYINWSYIIYMLPVYILTLIASMLVNSTYRRYSDKKSYSNMTGAEAARKMLDDNGLYNVRIERVTGHLTDHYDPRANVVRLSTEVYDSTSISSIGVACHECGHALQYAKNYAPIKLRNAIIPITNIGSTLAMPVILIGILLSMIGEGFAIVAYVGVGMFATCVLFQLITLPVEINASRRGIAYLRENAVLQGDELSGAKKVLTAAAFTYVAALATSIAQLMYLLRIVASIRDDN